MANPDTSLLFGPYQAPRVKRGNRAYCLYRNSAVVISSWTDARISWPRCQVLGQQGGSGLLVDEELLWAIMSESVVAIKHWWGVGNKAIWNWRRAFGVRQWGTTGSTPVHAVSSQHGADAMRAREWTPAERAVYRRRAKRLGLGRFLKPRPNGRPWTKLELKILATKPDEEIAERIGRTLEAVRNRRMRVGRPRVIRPGGRRLWTKAELRILATTPDVEAARQTGRTLAAVRDMRYKIGIPTPRSS